MTELRLEVREGLAEVEPEAWDALVPPADPFLEHAFLHGLERSGSVGAGTPWRPLHLLGWRGRELVAAMPVYERSDSFGEYIFDFGLAHAATRAGLRYYPKLTSAVPFTPAPGRRLLARSDERLGELAGPFARSLRQLALERHASSVHVLFLGPDEQAALGEHRFTPRLWHQFQWHREPAWGSFEDYLGAMRAPSRKQVRRERAVARSHGLDLVMKEGPELTAADWVALERSYRRTAMTKGGRAFLTPAFFAHLREHHAARVAGALAYRHGEPVASALFLHRGPNLYGRYWGTGVELDSLHFELCYYLPLDWCFAHGITRFEGGAQGEHKLKRGFLPALCHSSHLILDPDFARAVREHFAEEAEAVQEEVALLKEHGPFRRASSAPADRGALDADT